MSLLKRIRTELELSQREFAKRIGLSYVQWNKIETGKCPLSKRTRLTLEEILKVNPLYLDGNSEVVFIALPFTENPEENLEALVKKIKTLDKEKMVLITNILNEVIEQLNLFDDKTSKDITTYYQMLSDENKKSIDSIINALYIKQNQ